MVQDKCGFFLKDRLPNSEAAKNRNAPISPTNQWKGPTLVETFVALHCHERTFALHAPPFQAVLQMMDYLKAKKKQQQKKQVCKLHAW